MTLSGVSSLIDQQQQLLRLFQTNNSKPADGKHNTSDNNGDNTGDKHHSRHSLDTVDKRNTEGVNTKDLTRSSSSSMQTLRRILEIEEFRKFSDILESKIDKKIAN